MVAWPSRRCRSVGRYEKLSRIGEGTYGVVYRARDKDTGEIVALKRIRLERRNRHGKSHGKKRGAQKFNEEGFPVTAMREVLLLQRLDHPNVVHLREVVVKEGTEVRESEEGWCWG